MIIGLSGPAGSGKDTVRAILEKENGFHGKAFADPLRDMAKSFLSAGGISTSYMTDRHLKESVIPELGFSYRRIVQTLGTEWGRSLDQDVWLNIVKSSIQKNPNRNYVISDVRFPNEFNWIKESGGVIWYIQRDVEKVIAHASESSLDGFKFDHTIFNTSTISALYDMVQEQLTHLVLTSEPQHEWFEP